MLPSWLGKHDRSLGTVDIEGAYPKSYKKHIWGNYNSSLI